MEPGRIKSGPLSSKEEDHFGAFILNHKDGRVIYLIVDDGKQSGWEHVSVSCMRKHRGKVVPQMPDWSVMGIVKDLFWEDTETVIQMHLPKAEYPNESVFTLHLWKCIRQEYVLPPKELVGIKDEPKLKLLPKEGE